MAYSLTSQHTVRLVAPSVTSEAPSGSGPLRWPCSPWRRSGGGHWAGLQPGETAGAWPENLNTDQGCQFSSSAWIDVAESNGVRVTMDGRLRRIDNVMVERVWRSLRYEDIYLRECRYLVDLHGGLMAWIDFYNHRWRHQGLGYKAPWATWQGRLADLAA